MTEIYVLIDPRSQQVRYVGMSHDAKLRLCGHYNRGSFRISLWLKELESLALHPRLEVVDSAEDRYQARNLELQWIRYFRSKGPIFNAFCKHESNGYDWERAKIEGAKRERLRARNQKNARISRLGAFSSIRCGRDPVAQRLTSTKVPTLRHDMSWEV